MCGCPKPAVGPGRKDLSDMAAYEEDAGGVVESKAYRKQKTTATILSLGLSAGMVLLLALVWGPRLDGWVREVVGDRAWLRLAAVAAACAGLVELVTFPVSFWSGYLVEHRFGLSNQGLGKWLWRQVKVYVVGGVLGLLLVLGLYAVLWGRGGWWGVGAAAGWLLVSVVLGRLLPVVVLPLFYRTERLADEALLGRLRHLAEGTGLSVEGVYRLDLSAETKKANAALTGLGKSRRVLLGDTLLKEFTPEEVGIVFAHEVGHHVYRHLPKMLALGTGLAVVSFGLVDAILRRAAPALGYEAFDAPGAFPLVLLVLTVMGLLAMPLQNAISRLFERQCDLYALRRTGDKQAYRSAFLKLARLNKADLDPPAWEVWLLEDHPPLRERLALADRPE